MRQDYVKSRIDHEDKVAAEAILHQMGMTSSQAIRMLFKSITLHRTLPIYLKVPNEETLQAMQADTYEIDNLEDYFNDLGMPDQCKK